MINWARAHELEEDFGKEGLGEVVDLFLSEVEEALGRLAATQDAATLEDNLHFLKGSALNLGFDAVGALCVAREDAVSAAAGGAFVVGPLKEMYQASRAEFLRRVKPACPAGQPN